MMVVEGGPISEYPKTWPEPGHRSQVFSVTELFDAKAVSLPPVSTRDGTLHQESDELLDPN